MNEDVLNQARTIHRTVRMLHERLVHRFNALNKHPDSQVSCVDLTFPQFNAMLVIRDRDDLTIKALAELLRVSPPSASAMVDRLVEMGMLEREQSQADRRTVIVRLSEKGREDLDWMDSQMLEALGYFLDELGSERAQAWCAIYEQIAEIIRREEKGTSAALPQEHIV